MGRLLVDKLKHLTWRKSLGISRFSRIYPLRAMNTGTKSLNKPTKSFSLDQSDKSTKWPAEIAVHTATMHVDLVIRHHISDLCHLLHQAQVSFITAQPLWDFNIPPGVQDLQLFIMSSPPDAAITADMDVLLCTAGRKDSSRSFPHAMQWDVRYCDVSVRCWDMLGGREGNAGGRGGGGLFRSKWKQLCLIHKSFFYWWKQPLVLML